MLFSVASFPGAVSPLLARTVPAVPLRLWLSPVSVWEPCTFEVLKLSSWLKAGGPGMSLGGVFVIQN